MILSIDTGFDILGLSLIKEDTELVFSVDYRQLGTFSENLVAKIDFHLKEHQIDKKELSAIVVNKGPGGYTGLRVGITTAKTLAYALKIPLYAYTSLDAMHYKHRFYLKRVITAVNAGRGEAYVKIFEKETSSDIKLIKQDELSKILSDEDLLITKNLNVSHQNHIDEKRGLSLEGAIFAVERNLKEDPFLLEPVYIREN